MTGFDGAASTSCAGAAARISAETGATVTAEQVRATLRDTASCLRGIQLTGAWRAVAVASGHLDTFRAGFVQAIELLEESAYEDVHGQRAVAVCRDCGSGDMLPIPCASRVEAQQWADEHAATGHAVVVLDGWPRRADIPALVAAAGGA